VRSAGHRNTQGARHDVKVGYLLLPQCEVAWCLPLQTGGG